ncbi:hypothetical protein QA633_43610 [Bradyrhizobium barranii]|uniref:hypothetical protein n=1 Tax=Bradyrhizobium barranii TaxID=2992140 RepID=UPI0024AE8966|nr:hypothetical protein [Bradyrhizobium barranii]WFT95061.1 hypothetical protein QA633_43610 [Bradyrhizobium barranii]
MIPDGIELCQLRQRRNAAGDTVFTGRFGNALVALYRDSIERDVWHLVAIDPSQPNRREQSPVRALARPADNADMDEGDFDEGDDGMDELPADLLETLKGKR